jgi:hypothetical protein
VTPAATQPQHDPSHQKAADPQRTEAPRDFVRHLRELTHAIAQVERANQAQSTDSE